MTRGALGRPGGYLRTAALSAASLTTDGPLFLLDYLLRFLRVALLLSLWRVVMAHRGPVSGISLDALLTYTLITEVFAEPLACRTQLDVSIWEGSIAQRLLRPLPLVGHYAAETFGRWALSFCLFSLPLLAAAPLLGVDPLPGGERTGLAMGARTLAFCTSLVLGVTIGLALEFLFGGLMARYDLSVWDLQGLRGALQGLASGALLPLAILPWGLGPMLKWLPFAGMASAPLRIYTATGPVSWLLAMQLGWGVALWLLTAWVWRANRERLVCYGG
ncbi:MAG TPA: ABC-2 family transporter protein [Armatimonadota bacterium]